MLAVQGYYDGNTIKMLEKITAKPNQRVIITFIDDSFDLPHQPHSTSMRGVLADCADPDLAMKEKEAWRLAAEKKHGTA